ncbi:MAG: hypothetical protein CM15mP130_3010 [Verrucomicrobiota bacterium]|nr:MAG: hypothetical protein CM15mP130_3010 [Verrucomicrobiota bacterium]
MEKTQRRFIEKQIWGWGPQRQRLSYQDFGGPKQDEGRKVFFERGKTSAPRAIFGAGSLCFDWQKIMGT